MGLYDKYILPKIVHFACSRKPNMRQREKVVPLAKGRVLEVGIGSGLNLPFYDTDKVQHVWGLEPSVEMWAIAQQKNRNMNLSFEFVEGSAESIPLDRASADTIVVTYTLCTIPDIAHALQEMRRVLKPGGELIFCEHGVAPDANVRKWQNRLNPVWKKLGGGCNLNRDIPSLLAQADFTIRDMETMYLPGWRPASFNYWGSAS